MVTGLLLPFLKPRHLEEHCEKGGENAFTVIVHSHHDLTPLEAAKDLFVRSSAFVPATLEPICGKLSTKFHHFSVHFSNLY